MQLMPLKTLYWLLPILSSMWPATAQETRRPDPARTEESSNGALELSVAHAKAELGVTRAGQNLRGILTITLKNISEQSLSLVITSPECDYILEIRSSSGSLVKP